MASEGSSLVRLQKDTVEKIDARRGKIPRAAYLAALVDADAGGEPSGTPRARKTKAETPAAPACVHPITRRIGDRCADCGATVTSRR